MAKTVHQFEITSDEIARVVTAFYAQVRRHPVLGPVFALHIPDSQWPAHEEKIQSFWRNAILRDQSYSGNPMRVHMETLNVREEHFPIWLDLFESVLRAELPDDTATRFAHLARRIGKGLVYGLSLRPGASDVPILR